VPLLRSTQIPLRATLLMDAPQGAVRRSLRRADVWTRTVRALGGRADVARPGAPDDAIGARAALQTGDLIRVQREGGSAWWPPRSLILRVDVPADPGDLPLPSLHLIAGPLDRCTVSLTTVSTGAGTLVTVDARVQAVTAVLTPTLRGRVLEAAQLLLGIALLAAREIQVVVAGAIVNDGRVLAARRTAPIELAGCWELPGGKVNPGETEQQALRRELDEELGLSVSIGERIGPDIDLGDNRVLRCYLARAGGARFTPNEHDAIQWVEPDGLDEMNWLEADRSILPELRLALLDQKRPI